MATLSEVATLAADATFRDKCTAASIYIANLIGNEVLGMEEPGALDRARYQLAVDTIRAPSDYTEVWAWLLASLDAIDGSALDETITFYTGANWNLVARVPV